MEGLHITLKDGLVTNMFRGVMIGSLGIHLSHLFYADDVIILSEKNQNDMDNIIRVLNVFYLESSLKVNINKSNLYGVGVPSSKVSCMAVGIGCLSSSLPFSFLGLLIGSNMGRIENWKILIDRFKARMSGWKANLLSSGGRITLIKLVLESLGRSSCTAKPVARPAEPPVGHDEQPADRLSSRAGRLVLSVNKYLRFRDLWLFFNFLRNTLSLVSKYLNGLDDYLDDGDSLEARKLTVGKSKEELELFDALEHKSVIVKERSHRVVVFKKAHSRAYSKPFTSFSFDFVVIGYVNEGEPSVIFGRDFLVTSKSRVNFGIGEMRIDLTMLEEMKDVDVML
ncbi:RNA-directed DNA polymerase, eukaryota, reverse transcriptase zinc-binding domain protein [Tanacetum coccineum]